MMICHIGRVDRAAIAIQKSRGHTPYQTQMKIQLFDKDQQAQLFPAGQTVFRDGDPGDHMFAVIEGAVDIIVRDKTVETVGPGGVFGEMALVEERPRSAAAVVKSDSRLVAIDRKRFMFLVQQNPFFALQLMTIMAARLRRMDEQL
jgi:CRP/FNR family transcriptional regulator, cyclic AMP receptor protein